jgi:2-phosphoglycolate phosphatase
MKAILFDLDGTLVDTAPDLGYAANLVRIDQGMAPLPLDDYRTAASSGAQGLLRVALNLSSDDAAFPQHRDRFLAYYREHLARASRPFPGMDAVFASIAAMRAVWGVVTNKPSWLTDPLMAQLDLTRNAACVISADQVARAKPAPDSLLHACTLLSLTPADCIYVGDDLRDIEAARAAGMYSVAADWGYLGESGPIADWGADVVLSTPQQLAQWLADRGWQPA